MSRRKLQSVRCFQWANVVRQEKELSGRTCVGSVRSSGRRLCLPVLSKVEAPGFSHGTQNHRHGGLWLRQARAAIHWKLRGTQLHSLFCAGVVLLGSFLPLRAQLAVGDRFPSMSGIALEGNLPATEGQVLLVDFWASWCAPCKASFPALAQLHAWYGKRGVVVLGVSVDENANDYAAFLKKQAPPFPIVRDHKQKLVSLIKVPVMPTTYVIGRDGRIRAILSGYHGKETDKALRTILNTTLAENSASP